VSPAKDNIGWIEYTSNMVLPVIIGTSINSTMMFIYYTAELFLGSSGRGENFGTIFPGNRTPEMLAQEHAYYSHTIVQGTARTFRGTVFTSTFATPLRTSTTEGASTSTLVTHRGVSIPFVDSTPHILLLRPFSPRQATKIVLFIVYKTRYTCISTFLDSCML
jgi:hypothetical protein